LFIYLFIHSFIHLLFIHSFIHLLFIYLLIYLFIHLFIYLFSYAFIYSFPFENVLLFAACGRYMSVYDTRCHQSKIIKDVFIAYQTQKPSPEGHWLSHPGLIPTIMASVATLKGGGVARLQVLEGGFSVVDFIVEQTW